MVDGIGCHVVGQPSLLLALSLLLLSSLQLSIIITITIIRILTRSYYFMDAPTVVLIGFSGQFLMPYCSGTSTLVENVHDNLSDGHDQIRGNGIVVNLRRKNGLCIEALGTESIGECESKCA